LEQTERRRKKLKVKGKKKVLKPFLRVFKIIR
jgi:hypothetical protein